MKNEPKVIYLNCYDEAETDQSYMPIDDDFDSLDHEFVLWSAKTPSLAGNIKYVHSSEVDRLQAQNKELREALDIALDIIDDSAKAVHYLDKSDEYYKLTNKARCFYFNTNQALKEDKQDG